MDGPVKLLQQVRRRVQSVTYGSPIYKMMLDQGPVPDRLKWSIPDPWPGDAKAGQALVASQPGLFDEDGAAQLYVRQSIMTHDWLRDLRSVGSDQARRRAIALIDEWLVEQESWDEESWSPEVLGARLSNWIAFYDFYAPQAVRDFTQRLLTSMARQLRHLLHTADAPLFGVDRLHVIRGLVYGGLALVEGERAIGLGLELLRRQLESELLADGGSTMRQPQAQAEMLRLLIDVRNALRQGQLQIPHELELAITRMVPALKLLRHGDGGLALFHGGQEGSALVLDAILTLSDVRSRVIKRLQHTGFERVTAGRALLLVDTGNPPMRPYDKTGHAGLGAFEFSIGRERMIVNCGSGPKDDPRWRQAMAATAAHSTLTLGDTNACQVLPEGGLGQRPQNVESQRYEQEGVQYVEISHDGYHSRFKALFHRRLSLSAEGDELRGRDVLIAPKGMDFTIRWHLHPSVNALLVQGGGAALLRLPSGAGWKLRVPDNVAGGFALEPSISCANGIPRRTLQLCLSGRTRDKQTIVEWALKRESIKKGG